MAAMAALLPYTERASQLTSSIDVASTVAQLRMLRSCDAQLFGGFGGEPGVWDPPCLLAMERLAAVCAGVLRCAEGGGRVVMGGSGTSGRVGYFVQRQMNAILRAQGRAEVFRYCISGGDAALLLSDELPEDVSDPLSDP